MTTMYDTYQLQMMADAVNDAALAPEEPESFALPYYRTVLADERYQQFVSCQDGHYTVSRYTSRPAAEVPQQRRSSGTANGRKFAQTYKAKPASEKQIAFLSRLASEKDIPEAEAERIRSTEWTMDEASSLIDRLLKKARKPEPETAPAVGEGFYRHDGGYAKVQRAVHGSGKLYAKVWSAATESWEYTPGLIGKLNPAALLSLEEAGEFGHLYGRCIACSRTLTDEESIRDGIGPVCKGHHFG
jgi:hypothetical protein